VIEPRTRNRGRARRAANRPANAELLNQTTNGQRQTANFPVVRSSL